MPSLTAHAAHFFHQYMPRRQLLAKLSEHCSYPPCWHPPAHLSATAHSSAHLSAVRPPSGRGTRRGRSIRPYMPARPEENEPEATQCTGAAATAAETELIDLLDGCGDSGGETGRLPAELGRSREDGRGDGLERGGMAGRERRDGWSGEEGWLVGRGGMVGWERGMAARERRDGRSGGEGWPRG